MLIPSCFSKYVFWARSNVSWWYLYNKTCEKRPLTGKENRGLSWQVIFVNRLKIKKQKIKFLQQQTKYCILLGKVGSSNRLLLLKQRLTADLFMFYICRVLSYHSYRSYCWSMRNFVNLWVYINIFHYYWLGWLQESMR